MLRAGIVGLPNVNPRCSMPSPAPARRSRPTTLSARLIPPESSRPDAAFNPGEIAKTQTTSQLLQFVDIAGGEGCGPGGRAEQISEPHPGSGLIIQVIRCFEDEDIHHVAGTIDPIRDIETILTELVMADVESVQKSWTVEPRMPSEAIRMPRQNTMCWESHASPQRRQTSADPGPQRRRVVCPETFFLLTAKPAIFAANVKRTSWQRQIKIPTWKNDNMPPTIMPATR